jgi:signal transduction histidine kinase
MHVIENLQELRSIWIERVSRQLARGEHVRAIFMDQLNHFFDMLIQSLNTGDPAWLNNVLDVWAESRTQTEYEQSESSIMPILEKILIATHDAIQEKYNGADGLALIGAILPVYSSALSHIAIKETELHIQHIAKELDDALIKMENLDKSKSDFISVAAHELKTPLTLIQGYASMLRDQFQDDERDSSISIYMKGMENGLRRLQEIINDMIDVSLIDNDMVELNFQPIWIKQLLEIARNELTRYTPERAQSFKVIDFDGSEQMTYGDPERLYQAIRNLLSNAIKYTPDGGRITVGGRKLPGFVEIAISDTGIGIDEAFHEQIFEKFGRLGNIQLHSSGKTKFKGGGPGLGLPITKGLIEAHGGTIWVESEGYDEVKFPGTTFHVLLPILQEPPDKKIAKLFGSQNEPDHQYK